MTKDYVCLTPVTRGNAARFGAIRHFDNSFLLVDGVSLANEFPPNAELRMNDAFPDNIGLYDTHFVIGGLFMVSERLMNFLLGMHGVKKELEFYPVRVLNHKGREVKEAYFVVNTLNLVDCIDRNRTKYELNTLDDDAFIEVSNLHLDESAVRGDLTFFRMKYLNYKLIVKRDFANEMRNQGFKHFDVLEIEDIKV